MFLSYVFVIKLFSLKTIRKIGLKNKLNTVREMRKTVSGAKSIKTLIEFQLPIGTGDGENRLESQRSGQSKRAGYILIGFFNCPCWY